MSIDRKTTDKDSALELFTSIPKFRLVNLNTPVERLDRLRQAIPGAPQLWIKRDDLTGYLGGGNKLRKLEYVMADALVRRATTIVTTGSITSNLARTTAMTARRLGLMCELVLSGGDPKAAHANWRMAELLGVKIHTVSSSKEQSSATSKRSQSLGCWSAARKLSCRSSGVSASVAPGARVSATCTRSKPATASSPAR